MKIIIRRIRYHSTKSGKTLSYSEYWDNLNNEFNLNNVCRSLGIESPLLSDPHVDSRKGYHIAPYEVYESLETGVIIRLGMFKYKYEQLENIGSGSKYDVEYHQSDKLNEIMEAMMEAMGLEYKEFPTPAESIALMNRLVELDDHFKTIFNLIFEIEDISDDIHYLASSEWEKTKERHKISQLRSN